MLSLVAPFTAEEMWERLGHQPSVALALWPAVDPTLVKAESVTAVVQINGKIKARIDIDPEITDKEFEEVALADSAVREALGDKKIIKVIARAPKLVNIVIDEAN